MALSSYSDLVTEIGNWLNRSDLTSEIPTFVRLFEARMNRRLSTPDQEISAFVTLIAGQATYSIPSSIRRLKMVIDPSTGLALTAMLSGVIPNYTVASPGFYTIDGTTITLTPAPDGVTNAATITITGYNVVPPLDGVTNTTNWLLTSHPDAYLFGTLAAAAAYLRDDEHFGLWRSQADEVVQEVIEEANQRKVPIGPLKTMPAVFE